MTSDAKKRPFSDELANKVIAEQVAEIDRLSEEVKDLRAEVEAHRAARNAKSVTNRERNP